MPSTTVSLVKVGSLAITRAMLGAGVGLLVADRLEPSRQRVVGGTLLAIGLVSTVPLLVSILRGVDHAESAQA